MDSAITEQPFAEPAPAGAPVDVDFTVDPGGPLEAIPDAAPAAHDADLARLHAVPVELADPFHTERFNRIWKLPPETGDRLTICAEAGEETWREEMHVAVVDHGGCGSARRMAPPTR